MPAVHRPNRRRHPRWQRAIKREDAAEAAHVSDRPSCPTSDAAGTDWRYDSIMPARLNCVQRPRPVRGARPQSSTVSSRQNLQESTPREPVVAAQADESARRRLDHVGDVADVGADHRQARPPWLPARTAASVRCPTRARRRRTRGSTAPGRWRRPQRSRAPPDSAHPRAARAAARQSPSPTITRRAATWRDNDENTRISRA